MKYYYSGSGFVNTLINKLPFEMHIPGYNYCGPGTKLESRLKRGDLGVNTLDESCRKHDIAYTQNKDLALRHKADSLLAKHAMEVVKSKKASVGERLSALGVAGVMKAKVKLGMGLKKNNNMKNCLRLMQKVKQSTQKLQNDIDQSIAVLQGTAIVKSKRSTSATVKKPPRPRQQKRVSTPQAKSKRHRPPKINNIKEMMDVDFSPPPSPPPPSQSYEMEIKPKVNRNRKNENFVDPTQPQSKEPKLDLNEPINYAKPTTSMKRKLSLDADYLDNGGGGDINTEKKTRLF